MQEPHGFRLTRGSAPERDAFHGRFNRASWPGPLPQKPGRCSKVSTALAIAARLLLALIATSAEAKRLYQWKDAQGITHFSDSRPGDAAAIGLKETVIRAEPQPFVQMLDTDAGEGARRYTFSNRLAGPVEMELSFDSARNVASEPLLPLRVVLAAQRETPVAVIRVASAGEGSYGLRYRAVPGDPRALPDLSARYALPLPPGTAIDIHQGFDGPRSHNSPQSRYAVDFSVPEGTAVLAARDGVVMEAERDFHGSGSDLQKFGNRANLVRVLHEDGSMAIYAHLALEGVDVAVGQRVRVGQRLGYSGNTGFSSGPHLHFSVQVNMGMELVSFPFSIEGVRIPGS